MNQQRFIYFDNNATTRVAPEVTEAMLPFLTSHWGNPSSGYRFGKQVAGHMDRAREQVAALIHADPGSIVFTSCGTESNNAAIHSALILQPAKRHVLTTSVEHSANINYTDYLRRRGYEVTLLPVEPDGSLDLHLLDQSIRPDTAIVSVMWANNETGVMFPVEEIGAVCRSKSVPFHTDAVQVAGKLPVNVGAMEVDFLSLSAHKIHAPKGIGLLYVSPRVKFHPYVIGGHQERGRRGGTENVVHIVGFGRAAELALEHLSEERTRVRAMRDRLERGLLKQIPGTTRNGAADPRLPNTCNLSFSQVEAEAVLAALDGLGVCASSGSACTTGSLKPSHVMTAMGVGLDRARGCMRFSLGRYNTEEEVDFVLKELPGIIARLRAATPVPAPEDGSAGAESGRTGRDSGRGPVRTSHDTVPA